MYNIIQKEYPNGDIQMKIFKKALIENNNDKIIDNGDIFIIEQRELYYSDDDRLNEEFCKNYEKKQKKQILNEQLNVELTEEQKEKIRLNDRLRNDKRDKQKVYDKARANTWHWFATFTFSSDKVDRTNYDECKKKLCKWLNNIKNRYCPDLKYLCVPELHEDNISWHFHGLLANVDELSFVQGINNKKDSVFYGMPLKDKNGNDVYNLECYNLGYASFTKVRDTRRVSGYIVKYMTKQISFKLEGKNRHIASRNLDMPKSKKMFMDNEGLKILKSSINPKWEQKKEVAKGTMYENEIHYIEL